MLNLSRYNYLDYSQHLLIRCIHIGTIGYSSSNGNQKAHHAPNTGEYNGPLFIIREPKSGDVYEAFITNGGIQQWKTIAAAVHKNGTAANGRDAVVEDPDYAGVVVNSDTVSQLELPGTLRTNVSLSTLLKVAVSRIPWLLVLRRDKHHSLTLQKRPTTENPSNNDQEPTAESINRKSKATAGHQRHRRSTAVRSGADEADAPFVFPDSRRSMSVGGSDRGNTPRIYLPGDFVPEAYYVPFDVPTADVSSNAIVSANNAVVPDTDSPPPVFPAATSDFLVGTHPSEFPVAPPAMPSGTQAPVDHPEPHSPPVDHPELRSPSAVFVDRNPPQPAPGGRPTATFASPPVVYAAAGFRKEPARRVLTLLSRDELAR